MRTELSQSQKQVQKLSANMRQSLAVLQMSAKDLADLIKKEVKKNPTIEVFRGGQNFKKGKSDSDAHQEYLESIQYEETIQEHVMNQVLDWGNRKKEFLWKVLGLLDDRGFLPYSAHDVAQIINCSDTDAEQLISELKHLHPEGIGSKNIAEFLDIQLKKVKSNDSEIAREIVRKYFDELKSGKIDVIKSAMHVPREKVIAAGKLISRMNFSPISGFSNEPVEEIVPDVKIYKRDGEWVIDLNSEAVPEIRYSKSYREAATCRTKFDKSAWLYLKKQSGEARKLCDAILRRGETLVAISREILASQMEYFENGEKFLHVLRLRDVAKRIGLNISTVSRAIKDKYISTPYGTKGMKFFFESGERGTGGYSKRAIVERIHEFLSKSKKKVTDYEIVKYLESSGVLISRRTVSKYRKWGKIA